MKKMVIWIAFAICAIVMTSCSDLPAENKAETTAEPPTMQTTMEKTTTIETTMEVISTIELTEGTTTTKDTEVLPTEIETTTAETYETLPDMFERLMEFSGDRGFFYGKADITKTTNLENEEIGVHFRIVGFDHNYRGVYGSYYYIQIIDIYGEERFADQIISIDYNAIYEMHWRGHLDDHLYGRPPLQIGEDYFRYINWRDFVDGDYAFAMGLVMDIEEIDGKQYLYGYGIDMSVWDCAEKITDYEENQIYKVGQHDKVIAYLNSIGKSLPTFDYRCELFEWMDEVGIYTKE